MKKTLTNILLAVAMVCGVASCSDDDVTVPKNNIDQTTVTYKTRPGEVIFHWTKPENPDYYYIKVQFNDPKKGTRIVNASAYADSLVIDGLYAKYGDLDYTFTAVSRDGGETSPFTVKAQAGAVLPSVSDTGLGDAFNLTVDQLWTDDQETSEGPIKNLVDGNANTFFHMSWSNPSPFPHYIRVNLKKKVWGVQFGYVCRNNNNKDNPKQITVLASNTDNLADAWTLETLTGLPTDKAASYDSPHIVSQTGDFQYLWLRIDSSTSGSNWIALSILTVNEVNTKVVDPEHDED